jgi:hypothetical protein
MIGGVVPLPLGLLTGVEPAVLPTAWVDPTGEEPAGVDGAGVEAAGVDPAGVDDVELSFCSGFGGSGLYSTFGPLLLTLPMSRSPL